MAGSERLPLEVAILGTELSQYALKVYSIVQGDKFAARHIGFQLDPTDFELVRPGVVAQLTVGTNLQLIEIYSLQNEKLLYKGLF
jgi:hypothetical protein